MFAGLTTDTARFAMREACKLAGIAHYHPHDLPHRRASLWLKRESVVQVSQWIGHAKTR